MLKYSSTETLCRLAACFDIISYSCEVSLICARVDISLKSDVKLTYDLSSLPCKENLHNNNVYAETRITFGGWISLTFSGFYVGHYPEVCATLFSTL